MGCKSIPCIWLIADPVHNYINFYSTVNTCCRIYDHGYADCTIGKGGFVF